MRFKLKALAVLLVFGLVLTGFAGIAFAGGQGENSGNNGGTVNSEVYPGDETVDSAVYGGETVIQGLGGSVDQDFYGWRMDSRSPAYPNWPGDWVKGDLGKNWREGDWVSYVLVLNGYEGTLPSFKIGYDFYNNTGAKDAAFVDLLRNFKYKVREPYGSGVKPNDVTPALQSGFTSFTPDIINRPFPEGTSDDQNSPPEEAYWQLTPDSEIPTIPEGKSIVIYFEAHLSLSFVWQNGKEYVLNDVLGGEWGSSRYAGWTAPHNGSGYWPGSSSHFWIGEDGGKKTVPIPVPPKPTGSISGMKFNDKNGNGTKDAGEPGLGGWIIKISTELGDIPFTWETVTVEDGSYSFGGLVAGEYTISEIQQKGWTQTAPAPVPPGNHVVNLGEGQKVSGKDFGNFKGAVVSGCKWNDLNGNGNKDPGEPGLEDWKITAAKGTVAKTAYTGADGCYEFIFDKDEVGDWVIGEELQKGWEQTYPGEPGTWTVHVQSGTVVEGANFGNFKTAKVFGYKWNDENGNRVWDDGEPGLPEWQITAAGSGEPKTTSTNESGYYEFIFNAGDAGDWVIGEEQQEGWTQTYPGDKTHPVSIQSGDVIGHLNFGNAEKPEFITPVLSGHKWNDLDGDGEWDEGEPPIEGWKITATPDCSEAVSSDSSIACPPSCPKPKDTLTDGDGYYEFTFDKKEVGRWTWTISEESRGGWKQTYPAEPGTYGEVEVNSGDYLTGYDFGNFQEASVSGHKWNDLNGDGVWDEGEPVLEGWKIIAAPAPLLKGVGTASVSEDTYTFTDEEGYYEFTFGPEDAGTWVIREELQEGWEQTAPADGYYPVDIESGAGLVRDFGNFREASVSGHKWNDKNHDGIWDQGEPALEGWEITASMGEDTRTVSTDAYGYYEFTFGKDDVGEWTIAEVLQEGWNQSAPDTEGGVYEVTVSSGTYEENLDFGNWKPEENGGGEPQPPIVGGHKWNDLDGDGEWDEGEPPLANWEIIATYLGYPYDYESASVGIANGTVTRHTYTNGDGYYEFNFVEYPLGLWRIEEVLQDGWEQTAPEGGYHEVTVSEGTYRANLDFGNFKKARVSGHKWNDLNGNGIKDAGESYLEGWTIKATNGRVTKVDVTDGNGYYEFTFNKGEAGDWTISEVLQSGWNQTAPAGGVYTVKVQSGTDAADRDFGNRKPTTSGGGGGGTTSTPEPVEVPPEPPVAVPPPAPPVTPPVTETPPPPVEIPPEPPVAAPPAPPAEEPPLPHTGGSNAIYYLLGTILLGAGLFTRRSGK
jgi:hypothetical protein